MRQGDGCPADSGRCVNNQPRMAKELAVRIGILIVLAGWLAATAPVAAQPARVSPGSAKSAADTPPPDAIAATPATPAKTTLAATPAIPPAAVQPLPSGMPKELPPPPTAPAALLGPPVVHFAPPAGT